MLTIERAAQETTGFDPGGSLVLSLYLHSDPCRGDATNLGAQARDVLRPVRSGLRGDPRSLGKFEDAATRIISQVLALDPFPRSVAAFACPDRGWSKVVPMRVAMAASAFWSTEMHLRPLLAALDEAERVVVALVDGERGRVFRVCMGEIEEQARVAHATRSSDFDQRSPWQVRRHLDHLLDASRLNCDRIFVGGPEKTVYELIRLMPRRVRERTRVLPGLSAESAEASVLDRVLEGQGEAEREAEEELVDNLMERDRARSVFGGEAVLEAASDACVHTLVRASGTELSGAECPVCGWLTLHAVIQGCPRCASFLRESPDLVEHLIRRVMRDGGRVEEVRGPARRTLLRAGGLAALLRHAPEPVGARRTG